MNNIAKLPLNLFKALNSKYLYLCAAFFTIPCIAEASEAGSQIKEGVGKITGLIMVFAGLMCVVFAVLAGIKFAKGEKESGKIMLIGCGISAGAVLIVKALFSSFGMADANVDADFSF
jgi:hypothetical protein